VRKSVRPETVAPSSGEPSAKAAARRTTDPSIPHVEKPTKSAMSVSQRG
jgi:hypothetical protein